MAADRNPGARAGVRREAARAVKLWRYPVKSMAGEPLDRVEVPWNGLVGDRRWALSAKARGGTGFRG